MNKTAIILFVAIIAVSGCTSDNANQSPGVQNTPEETDNSQNNPEETDNSLIGDDSTTTFTTGGENMTMTLEADNDSETYDFMIEQKQNLTENQYFSRYGAVNLSARIMCGLTSQIAYNYSNVSEGGDSSGLEESDELSEGLGGSEDESGDSELPSWVFEEFNPDEVSYTLIDKGSSEELATCQPTREEINLEINIEQDSVEPDSENSEGLS